MPRIDVLTLIMIIGLPVTFLIVSGISLYNIPIFTIECINAYGIAINREIVCF